MEYTIGTKFNNRYPIWSPKGDIIAECLNYEDAVMIINALKILAEVKELL